MNSIRQIREQYDLITEKEESEDRKLATLVRAGLYDAKKLPALKKALEKSSDKMTAQEKRMLINLLDSLINQVVSSDQVYRKVKQNVQHMNEAKEDYLAKFDPRFNKGYPSDKEMPSVLILKRKAIRVYPDNQKVALYYSQALDKYVTIPFNDVQFGLNEAKSDDEGKKKRFVRLRPKKVGLMKRKVVDAAHLLNKTGEYSSALKRFSAIKGRTGSLPIAAGTMFNDMMRKRNIKNRLKDRIANRPTAEYTPPKADSGPSDPYTGFKPKANQSAPKESAPAKASEPKKAAVPVLKTRTGSETRKRMESNRKAGRKIDYSKGALLRAATMESFYNRVDMLREARQYGSADMALDAASFLPGPAGSAASLASAGMSISRGDYVGAALDAAGALPLVGYAAKAAKAAKVARALRKASKATKVIDKAGDASKALNKADHAADAVKATKTAEVAAKENKLAKASGPTTRGAKAAKFGSKVAGIASKAGKGIRLASKVAAIGAGALAGAGGSNSNDYVLSKDHKHDLGKSNLFKASSGFENKGNSNSAQQARDATLSRKANQAMMRESRPSYVLSTGDDRKQAFGLAAKVSTSKGKSVSHSATGSRDAILSRKASQSMVKEDVLSALRNMVDNNITKQTLHISEQEVNINNTTAKKILHVYESVNDNNKKQIEKMLNESAESFDKIAIFAVRQ